MSNLLPIILLLLLIFISILLKNTIGFLALFIYSLGLSIYNIRYGLNLNVVFGLLGAWFASFLYYKNKNKDENDGLSIEGFDNSIEIESAKDTFEIQNEKYNNILNRVNNELAIVLKEYMKKDVNIDELIILLDNKNIKNVFDLSSIVIEQRNTNNEIFNYLDESNVYNFCLLYRVPNIDYLKGIELTRKFITLDTLSDKYKRNNILRNDNLLKLSLEYLFHERKYRPHHIILIDDILLADNESILSSSILDYNIFTDNEYYKDILSIVIFFEDIGLIDNDDIGETIEDLREIEWLYSRLSKLKLHILDTPLFQKYNIKKKIEIFLNIQSNEVDESNPETFIDQPNEVVENFAEGKISLEPFDEKNNLTFRDSCLHTIGDMIDLIGNINKDKTENKDILRNMLEKYLLFIKGFLKIILNKNRRLNNGIMFIFIGAILAILN
tara:strand:- start:3568 stop:4890 length:1323 start_codon:yes stop_codon:yes gene_type:complete